MKNMLTRRNACFIMLCPSMMISGCSNIKANKINVGIRRIRLVNTTERTTHIEISVKKSGSVVYDRTRSISGTEGDEAVTTDLVDESLQQPADYAFSARDLTRGHSVDLPRVSQLYDDVGDSECYEVMLVIDENRLNAGHSVHETCDL